MGSLFSIAVLPGKETLPMTDYDTHVVSLCSDAMKNNPSTVLLKYELKHTFIKDSHRQLKVERLFCSTTAPKCLKNEAAKETLNVLRSAIIQDKTVFDDQTWWRLCNHTNPLKLLSIKSVLLKLLTVDSPLQSMGDMLLAETDNNDERFSEIIMKNAVLLMNDSTIIALKLSDDDYYIMIVGKTDHDGTNLDDIVSNCRNGFIKRFGNDILLIDVISEIPVEESSKNMNNSCIVGEIMPAVFN